MQESALPVKNRKEPRNLPLIQRGNNNEVISHDPIKFVSTEGGSQLCTQRRRKVNRSHYIRHRVRYLQGSVEQRL